MTENEKNSPVNQKSSTSCTTSTDSGVIIIDNTATFNGGNGITTSIPTTTETTSATDKPPYKTKEATNDSFNDDDTAKSNNKNNATKINISNYINITPTNGSDALCNGQAYKTINTTTTSSKPSSKNVSPTVSVRSTSISIVSIDENAIDSSVVDSDSDFEDDTEGVHSKYIVRKLGQQTTYPPNSPDIPNINKGLTVLSHQILPNGNSLQEATPFGNHILKSSPSTAPKIGSIALTNSTDVTFGDKHYYPGPVTIQQFLIDSRNGQDNPSFDGDRKESASSGLNDSQKINIPHQQPYKFISNRKAVILTGATILLTILIAIIIVVFTTVLKPTNSQSKILGDGDDSRKNIPINSTIDNDDTNNDESFNGTLQFLHRDEWDAHPAKSDLDKLVLPVHRVVISHTASETCFDRTTCTDRVRVIQEYHMYSFKFDDIGYNFLIGGDGRVYEGRGWDKQGAHTKGYNTDSIGISFVGTFTTIKPTESQLEAAKLLIEEGVRLKKLVPEYRLYGARQLGSTQSPGDELYGIIRKWPHWSEKII